MALYISEKNQRKSGPKRARTVGPLSSILMSLPIHLEPHEYTYRKQHVLNEKRIIA